MYRIVFTLKNLQSTFSPNRSMRYPYTFKSYESARKRAEEKLANHPNDYIDFEIIEEIPEQPLRLEEKIYKGRKL